MQITRVETVTRSVVETAEYYEGVLGLSVARRTTADGERAEVALGDTMLVLRQDDTAPGDQHYAFLIPANQVTAAHDWLAQRVALLSGEHEAQSSWNARSVYFHGPDRSVLEVIARRDLGNAADGPFGPRSLLGVSEVGIAVPDVVAVADRLGAEAGIRRYVHADDGSPTFTTVGDLHGMLVLVAPGRTWFPTENRVVAEPPITVTATGATPGTYDLAPGRRLVVR
ncbi:VOC family protein [Myceligenerans pegani]|uniref:VOC domain-containing protein n=1 Tax=Myceligenerans pegani TaxID=2776917 RepID=A0ABR9N4T7_9MICO|nr:hypothetical protein [Myceligenerans sp. TRM 65318]MBE1878686.1 hypothetical protein [Myceligenerans sp. TRM 65318]MBE3020957.1 hypothetical protein [Myceligenerans sp. TRM 65318]